MDLELKENGNGGDLLKKPKDLSVIQGFQNMPYLAMFGGNLEASTPSERLENEQAFDWWGNTLIFDNDPQLQMNSLTERTLQNVPLNSEGRSRIEQAVRADLDFMRAFAIVAVTVSIVSTDKVVIGIRLTKPDNLENKDFIFIWDATLKELSVIPEAGGGSVSAYVLTPEGDPVLTPEGGKLIFY